MIMRSILYIALACIIFSIACTTPRPRRAASRTTTPVKPVAGQPASEPANPNPNISYFPRQLGFSNALLQRLRVPAGFKVTVFARGVSGARVIEVAPDGTVYVTQPDSGQVTMLKYNNGVAGTRKVVVTGLGGVHGITIHGNKLYLATPTHLFVADLQPDGSVSRPRTLGSNLPAGGRHPNRTMAFGPDGLLYFSVGSNCNDCVEPNPEYASILQMRADGSGRRVYAGGLRNTMAFAWHPVTHAMWGMDQGSDGRGPNLPPEELNHLINGRNYGWPWCYGNHQVDAVTAGQPAGMTKEQFCAGTEPMTLGYQAHSSPIQIAFYSGGQFPAAYRNDAFQTFHGSWNRKPAVGYKVVRIHFNPAGQPMGFEDFLTGFLTGNGTAQFGRPAGLAVAHDGSLLIGDDSNGVIYRVAYQGHK